MVLAEHVSLYTRCVILSCSILFLAHLKFLKALTPVELLLL